jgi:putative salt-induced outer membrane protein
VFAVSATIRPAAILSLGLLLCGLAHGPADLVHAAEEDDVPLIDLETSGISAWAGAGSVQHSIWRGEAELGLLETRGNANTSSFQTKGRIQNERRHWRHTGRLEAVRIRDSEVTTTEFYKVSQKSAFKITEAGYLFELIRYQRNRFEGFQHRLSEVVGYGYRLVRTEQVTLDLESGPGARQTTPNAGERKDEAILLISTELNWAITPVAKFNEFALVEIGELSTQFETISALTLQLAGGLSLRASYQLTHNSDVPAPLRNTNSNASVTLVYSF